MLSIDELLEHKSIPCVLAARLTPQDLKSLITLMMERQTNVRYAAYLVLRERCRLSSDVYPYWDLFLQEVGSPNAFRRDAAVTMLAENVRWDTTQRFDAFFPRYPDLLHDSSFVVCRGVIASIGIWLEHRPDLAAAGTALLMDLDATTYRHPNLILSDCLKVLIPYQKRTGDESVGAFVMQALTGGLLRRKNAAELEELWIKTV